MGFTDNLITWGSHGVVGWALLARGLPRCLETSAGGQWLRSIARAPTPPDARPVVLFFVGQTLDFTMGTSPISLLAFPGGNSVRRYASASYCLHWREYG